MEKVNVLDEIELKNLYRKLYRDIGFEGMLQVLYEQCFSIQLCLEVIKEEMSKEVGKE